MRFCAATAGPQRSRFLALKGDVNEAGTILETLAVKTGLKVETNIAEELRGLNKFNKQNKNEKTIADLFKTRQIRNGNQLLFFSF